VTRRRITPGILTGVVVAAVFSALMLWQETTGALRATPGTFDTVTASLNRVRITDRHGTALNTTYGNRWNLHDAVAIHEIPLFLIDAFVAAEDKRFFSHSGQDWAARFSALVGNVIAMRSVRGASTISEQVVRMIHPRPRTLWVRWLEGWEAERLERTRTKLDILEFYLNQVPYAANRRGVVQAATYYFDRDLETLSKREMLALAALVRAPSRMDLFSGDGLALDSAIERLASRLLETGRLGSAEFARIASGAFDLKRPALAVDARDFLRHIVSRSVFDGAVLRTTLDGELQGQMQRLLDQRLKSLAGAAVANAAMLVADHTSGEILAWVIGGAADDDVPGRMIDTVTTPRQPGSSMKPFLYGLALANGWTAATLIADAPLTQRISNGLHSYKNYSHTFHGLVTLRNALGNSLNIPAVRTIQFTGTTAYLSLLGRLGFTSLSRNPDHYGDGLALGNGEVTLLELVQAYGALANRGIFRPFVVLRDDVGAATGERVFSPETASLIGDILSDPGARSLEFGSGSLLNLTLQTAVKTGTSNDYRDSWAVGYNDRYVVGVWMGNLDQSPTLGVTGSTGPALALRGAFDVLNRHRETKPLWLSPRLSRYEICADSGAAFTEGMACPRRSEFFSADTAPEPFVPTDTTPAGNGEIRLRQPTPGLHMAYDPRLAQDHQAFEFDLQGVVAGDIVEWHVDDGEVFNREGARYLWPVSRGVHSVSAVVLRNGRRVAHIDETEFVVK